MAESDHKTSQENEPAVSPSQRLAIDVLLAGGTDTEAARAASVARETVCRWRHSDADFIAALNRERHAIFDATRDRLRVAGLKAIETLSGFLTSSYAPTRMKAASILLRSLGNLGATLPPGETNPEDIRASWNGVRYRRELRSLGLE